MLGKAYRYKTLDFTDDTQFTSQQTNWYSYILQDVIKDTSTRTQVTDKANFHWWYSSETLAWPRLFTFTGKIVGLDKAKRRTARNELISALQPEWNPNVINRWFYQLLFQDDWGAERFAFCKVFTMPEARNGLDNPVIDFRFELLSESEKIYSITQKTATGTSGAFGGNTLPNTLPNTISWFVWAIPVNNEWNWIAPCKITVVGTATNPKIFNLTNGNKYRINWVTTNLVLDNRNLLNNPLENFIVTDNGQNIKAQRNSGADIFLQAGINQIAVLTDDPTESPTVTITWRDTFIW